MSRQWFLDSTHRDYGESVKLLRRTRELIKYGAIQFKLPNDSDNDEEDDDEKEETEIKWRWIGDGVRDHDANVTNYSQITNGKETFSINDVVEVKHATGINMRPWIGRIMQLFDNEREYSCTLRWFWFWNQIIDEDNVDYHQVQSNAIKHFKHDFPPRSCDVFETSTTNLSVQAEEPVVCFHKKVYLTPYHSNQNVVDGINVFRCQYFYDYDNTEFVMKNKKDLHDDEQQLIKTIGSENNNSSNNRMNDVNENENNDNAPPTDEDNDIDLADITLNAKKDVIDQIDEDSDIEEDESLPEDSSV